MFEVIVIIIVIFFFQAEDGIRDIGVTGVQTCALPICPHSLNAREVNFIALVVVQNLAFNGNLFIFLIELKKYSVVM